MSTELSTPVVDERTRDLYRAALAALDAGQLVESEALWRELLAEASPERPTESRQAVDVRDRGNMGEAVESPRGGPAKESAPGWVIRGRSDPRFPSLAGHLVGGAARGVGNLIAMRRAVVVDAFLPGCSIALIHPVGAAWCREGAGDEKRTRCHCGDKRSGNRFAHAHMALLCPHSSRRAARGIRPRDGDPMSGVTLSASLDLAILVRIQLAV